MRKYVDSEELKKRFTGAFREVHVDQIKAIIDEMPDAQIKCGDCKYFIRPKNKAKNWCGLLHNYPLENWYCANARKE